MAEPLSEEERRRLEEKEREEVIFSIGPVEIVGRRRRPDDPLRKAFEDLDKALADLGAALLDTPLGRLLGRSAGWLNTQFEKLDKRRGRGDDDKPDTGESSLA